MIFSRESENPSIQLSVTRCQTQLRSCLLYMKLCNRKTQKTGLMQSIAAGVFFKTLLTPYTHHAKTELFRLTAKISQ